MFKIFTYLASLLSRLGWFKKLFAFLASASAFEFAAKLVFRWVVGWTLGSALFKAVNLAFMAIAFYLVMDVLGGSYLSELQAFIVSGLSGLPPSIVCALGMLDVYGCLRMVVSVCASVGSVKLLLRLVLR